MKNLVLSALLCVLGIILWTESPAQVTPQPISRSTGSLTSGTIDSQFIYLTRISRTEEDFKLVRRRNLDLLRQNVSDSLSLLRKEASDAKGLVAGLTREAGELRDSLSSTRQELDNALKLEKTTNILGMHVSTTTYNIIVWGLVILLIIFLSYNLVRMGQNNVNTREARKTLEDLQAEFDQHRKKSLEKEQKLMRQLQDEINKGNA